MLTTLANHLQKKLPKDSLLRVMLGFQGIVGHERYQQVVKILTKAKSHAVLDVGSCGASQLAASGHLQVLSVDLKPKVGVDVVANVSHLPFSDHVFDCVTAIDVLEHIRSSEREKAINELKRCGKIVLVHTPLQDNVNFMGKAGDILLFNYLKNSLNIVDENTREHLDCDQPRFAELNEQGFKVMKPDWNLNVWLILMKCRYLRIYYHFIAPALTLLYLLALRKVNTPPFYGAYLMYTDYTKTTDPLILNKK